MLKVNVSNTWKNIKYGYVNVNNSWKKLKNMYVNISGVWKPLWSYSWYTGNWSNCSAECGGGTQTRTVYCKRNDNIQVDDAFCSGTKPISSQSCNTQTCAECKYVNTNSSDGRGEYYWMTWIVHQGESFALITYNGVSLYPDYSATSYSYGGYLYTRGVFRESDFDYETLRYYEVCREAI